MVLRTAGAGIRRMSRAGKIACTALAGAGILAAGTVGSGVAAAASGVGAADPASAAGVRTPGPGPSREWELGAWATVSGQDLWCPDSHPYLVKEHMAPGRNVPPGVRVIYLTSDTGLVSVIASTAARDGLAAGVKNMIMTNWAPVDSSRIVIDLNCTNDKAEAAPL